MARAFIPNFELTSAPDRSGNGESELSQEERIRQAEARCRTLVEQIPAVTFMASFEHRPDVILLDLYPPDISGEEVFVRLRDDDSTRNIPVLVITADATSGHADRLLAAGAQSYLTKPLEMPKLFTAIEESLQTGPAHPSAKG